MTTDPLGSYRDQLTHGISGWSSRRRRRVGTVAVASVMTMGIAVVALISLQPDKAGVRTSGAGSRRLGDHVVISGADYEVTCATPDEATLGADIKLDLVDDRFDRAAQITGEDASAVLALRADGRVERCPSATWVLAFGSLGVVDGPTAIEYARLRCSLPAQPDDARCAEGGPFWFSTDPSPLGTEGDGRSAVWVDGSAAAPPWRLDPLEVVARETSSAVPDSYQLSRVGLRVLDERADQVVVEVIYQTVTDTEGSDQREHYTLGRLPGREGWYPTAYVVAQYANEDIDDVELDAAWADGVDRVLVDVDRR